MILVGIGAAHGCTASRPCLRVVFNEHTKNGTGRGNK